jgi:hypothetical protein
MLAIHRPTSIASSALVSDSPEQHHHREPEHHEREVFGRAEGERELRERRGHQHQRHDAERARDERGDRRHAERGARAPLRAIA